MADCGQTHDMRTPINQKSIKGWTRGTLPMWAQTCTGTHTQVSQTYYYLAHVHIRLKLLFWFGEPDHEVLSSACWNFESCCKAFAAPRSMTCKSTSFDPHKVEGLNLSSGGVKRGQKKISTCKKMQIYSGLGLILVRTVMMAKSWRRVAHDIFYALRDLWNFAARHGQPSNSHFFWVSTGRPACMLCRTQGKLGRRKWLFQPEGGHLASGAIPRNRRQRDRKTKRYLDKAHHAFQRPWAKLAAGFSRRRPATTALCCIVARRGSAEARKGGGFCFRWSTACRATWYFDFWRALRKKNRVPLPGRNLRLTNSLCQVSCTTLLALQHAGGFRFSMPPSQRIPLPLSQQVAHKVFRVLPNVYLV